MEGISSRLFILARNRSMDIPLVDFDERSLLESDVVRLPGILCWKLEPWCGNVRRLGLLLRSLVTGLREIKFVLLGPWSSSRKRALLKEQAWPLPSLFGFLSDDEVSWSCMCSCHCGAIAMRSSLRAELTPLPWPLTFRTVSKINPFSSQSSQPQVYHYSHEKWTNTEPYQNNCFNGYTTPI